MISRLDRLQGRDIYENTALAKLNEVIDAVNKQQDIIRQIGEWGNSKGECLWCANLTEVNLDDRMIGCTTLDIPESYVKTCRMDKEFAEEEMERLQKENSDLKDEVERTRKALDAAVDGLKKMTWGCDSSDAEHLLKEIKEITTLEQKD